jgi:hypothetical protein
MSTACWPIRARLWSAPMTSVRDSRHPDFRPRPALARALACVLVGVCLATSAPVSAQSWTMEMYLRDLVAKQRRAAIAAELDALDASARQSDYDADEAELRAERKRYARDIQQAAAGAMGPLALVASVFAVESAADVFLTLFPFGKAAGAVHDLRKARKARKATRKLDEVMKQLAGALDDPQSKFVRAARHLPASDMSALVGITKRVQDPETVVLLMTRAARGEADLPWLEKMLKKGRFDGAFVEHYTRFDAYPSWRQLREVLDNQISEDARRSFMSKLVGFLGEDGAARHATSDKFQRHYGLAKGVKVQRGHESMDLMITDEANKVLLFAEVKNWGGTSWGVDTYVDRMVRQLSEHDAKIPGIVGGKRDGKSYKVKKLLMVAEAGYEMVPPERRDAIRARLGKGWEVSIIPSGTIENAGTFIDRVRKGD